jgi:intracellular multiplication protein IcmJ
VHPILLNATLTNFGPFISRKGHPKFRDLSKKVWQRDAYTCQFCGFQAKDYQEVINLDEDYHNNRLNNLITACVFCTQCFFLESVGERGYGGGSLIYMTEMTQNELNSFCHVLFCAMINNTQYKDTAQTIYQMFKIRSNIVDEKFGEGMSDPLHFAQVLLDYKANNPKADFKALYSKLRLLPARGRFTKQIQHWTKAAAKG